MLKTSTSHNTSFPVLHHWKTLVYKYVSKTSMSLKALLIASVPQTFLIYPSIRFHRFHLAETLWFLSHAPGRRYFKVFTSIHYSYSNFRLLHFLSSILSFLSCIFSIYIVSWRKKEPLVLMTSYYFCSLILGETPGTMLWLQIKMFQESIHFISPVKRKC